MVEVDEELAQLLSPSTFSLAECRAKSRAARTERDLKRILLGERLVMESRQNRFRAKFESEAPKSISDLGTSTSQADEPTSAAPQPIRNWTAQEAAKIEQGKKTAHKLRADAAMRKSFRNSWARSSAASEARSSAGWSFGKIANKTPDPQCQFTLDFSSLRQLTERYDLAMVDSARSMASSVGIDAVNQRAMTDIGQHIRDSLKKWNEAPEGSKQEAIAKAEYNRLSALHIKADRISDTLPEQEVIAKIDDVREYLAMLFGGRFVSVDTVVNSYVPRSHLPLTTIRKHLAVLHMGPFS
ncbi:hypothetical protein WJX77_001356 [Trebouxia sp. C0004]